MQIIRSKWLGSQNEIQDELKHLGIPATQASISRDLIELGIVKIKGVYRMPPLETGGAKIGEVLDIDSAGDNLIIVKTPPGQASMTALAIDRAKVPGIAGTVAGDDTLFLAVKSHTEQKMAIKHIYKILREGL